MSWDAIAAIAELVASLGVILSLIYLATQIRHQRTESLLTAGHELSAQINELYSVLSDNAEFADIFVKGLKDYNALNRVDKARFSAFFARLMRIQESMFSRYRQNLLDPSIWPSYEEAMRDYFGHPGLLDWWTSRSHWFTPEFQEHIAGCIANARDSDLFHLRH